MESMCREHMNGGTSIIPDLDSIEEFRVLTNQLRPGIRQLQRGHGPVISKSGSNEFHGNAFEFFRNTALDAKGYFDPTRSTFNQNQFGGSVGGPIRAPRGFSFLLDYQGTRTTQGVSTGNYLFPPSLSAMVISTT